MKVTFVVEEACQAKQRPRVNRQTGRIYTPNATHKYEKKVKEAYGDNPPFSGFIKIKITFLFKIPKSYNQKQRSAALEGNLRPTKADIDNYIKSILDGLNGIAYEDDRYVYSIEAEKKFAEESKTIIEIEGA